MQESGDDSQNISREIYPKVMQWIFFSVLVFIINGKFFYASHGWEGHLRPLAPVYLIVLKDIVALIFMIIFSFYSFFLDNKPIRADNCFILGFIFILLIVSMLHILHQETLVWMHHFFRNSILYSFFLIASNRLSNLENISNLISVLLFASFLNNFSSHIQFFISSDVLLDGVRSIGFTDNPNTAASILLMGFVISFVRMFYRKKLLYAISSLSFLTALLLTQSMTYLALTILFTLLFPILKFRRNWIFLSLAFLSFVVLFSSVYLSGYDVVNKIVSRFELLIFHPESFNSFSARMNNYFDAYQALNDDPLGCFFGVGFSEKLMTFDSTFLVIGVNFGILFLLIFIISNFVIFVISARRFIQGGENIEILFSLHLIYFLSGLVRNIFTRTPLNVISYVVVGMLMTLLYENEINAQNILKNKGVVP
ncbi:MAG: hypothetical protein AB8C84_00280 [Oligoflexales bacterium]